MAEKIIDIGKWSPVYQEAVGIALAQKIVAGTDWRWSIVVGYGPSRDGAVLNGISHQFGLNLRFCDYEVLPPGEHYRLTFYKDGKKYGLRNFPPSLRRLEAVCMNRIERFRDDFEQRQKQDVEAIQEEHRLAAEELLALLRQE